MKKSLFLFTICIFFFARISFGQFLDVGIVQLTSPLAPHINVNSNLRIKIRNNSSVPITSLKVSWFINGVKQVDVLSVVPIPKPTLSDLAPTAEITITNNFVDTVGCNIEFRILEVNNFADQNNINDTLKITIGNPYAGVKLIGPSPSDFKTIADAINAIRCNGINGVLTLKIRPGIYNENIELTGSEINYFNNNCSINLETESGLKDVVINSEQAVRSTVSLKAVRNISLKNLEIRNSNPYSGIGIQALASSKNIAISDCIVVLDSISNSKGYIGIAFADVDALSPFNLLNSAATKKSSIKNCTVSGGYYGILISGATTFSDSSIIVEKNNIRNVSYYGIFLSRIMGFKILSNHVTFRNSASQASTGYYIASSRSFGNFQSEVSRNYVTGSGRYGIHLNQVVGGTAENGGYISITNNMVAGGFFSNSTVLTENPRGLNIIDCGWINIYFNSINMDAPTNIGLKDKTTAFHIYNANNAGAIRIYNNVFANQNQGYAYYNATSSSLNTITESNNNDLWVANLDTNLTPNNGFAYWGGITSVSIYGFKNSSGMDQQSYSLDPEFFRNNNLHSVSNNLYQKGSSFPLTFSSLDFDGEVRAGAGLQDVGCDEIFPVGEDYGIIDVSPKVLRSNFNNSWNITFRYQGNTIGSTYLFIKYKIDGVEQLPSEEAIVLPVIVNSSRKEATLSVPPAFFINRGSNPNLFLLTVYIFAGNLNDFNSKNDTINVWVNMGLEGTYTIDAGAAPSSRTFNSLTDALSALKRGVSGPVIFELVENTYNEQLSLWNVYNSNSNNTITFRAKSNPLKTKLTYTPPIPEKYSTILFNNSQNIIIEHLTIENKGGVFGAAIQLSGNSKNIVVQNCVITVDSIQNPNQTKLYPIIATKLGSIYDSPYSQNASNIIIRNNRINGGNAGIAFFGTDTFLREKNLTFEKNEILSFNTYGLYAENCDVSVSENTFWGYSQMSNTGYGIYLKGIGDRYGAVNLVSRNKINNISLVGVYLSSCRGFKNSTAKKSTFLLCNNFIGGSFKVGSSNTCGLYIDNSDLLSIIHNTVFMDAIRSKDYIVNTSVPKCVIVNSNNYNIELFNNILYSNSGAIPLVYNVVGNRHTISNSDNNLYYTYLPESIIPLVLIYRMGTSAINKSFVFFPSNQETPSAALNLFLSDSYTKLNPRDKNSIANEVDFFNAPYDLHTMDINVDAKAKPNTGVTNDIDNNNRNVLVPDIGADEFVLSNYDIEINKITTKVLTSLAPNQISVKVVNRGKSSLLNKQIALRYTVSNNLLNFSYSSTDTFSLTIANHGDEQIYTFKKQLVLPSDNYYNICVEKVSSLLSLDTNTYNNNLCVKVQTGIQGDLYVGFDRLNPVIGTDVNRYFNTIQSAIDTLKIGVASNTNIFLNVNASPYFERVVIPSILTNDSALITITPFQKDTIVEIKQPLLQVGNRDTLHYTIQLSNAKKIRLTRLKVINTGSSFGTALHLTRNSADNIFDNCIFQVNSSTSSPEFAPIAITSESKFIYNDNKSLSISGVKNVFSKNKFIGGFASVLLLGKSFAENIYGNAIDSNEFVDYYAYGIYSYYSSNASISNNKFSPRFNASNSCINIAYFNASNAEGRINGNLFVSSYTNSIKLYRVIASPGRNLIISNNVFLPNFLQNINDSSSVINIRKSYYIGIYNNSFRYNGISNIISLQTEPTGDYYLPSAIYVKNNLFQIDSTIGALRKPAIINFMTNSTSLDFNYNAYYSAYNYRFAKTINGVVSSLNNWKALFNMDLNSIDAQASYISSNNLELQNKEQFYNKGIPLPEVTKDYKGDNRNPLSSDLGAYTYNERMNDVAISKIFNERVTLGVNKFSIQLLNVGKNDISSKTIRVEFSVDSGVTWMGNQQVQLSQLKESYDVQTFEFATAYILNGVLAPKDVCFRIAPSGRLPLDTSLNNEFVCKTLCVGLDRNTYTIGKNGNENFSSIKNALESLKCGYDTSIIFKVSSGVYLEEALNFNNVDMSSYKSITFTSSTNKPEDVVISPLGTAQSFQFFLDNAKNIFFSNVTFNSSNNNNFHVIEIYDSVSNIGVSNCKFFMNPNAGRLNNIAIVSNPDINDTYKIVKGISIENCEFWGGNYGIYIKSKENKVGYSKIRNNKIAGCLNGGIYLEGLLIDSISNNLINMQNSSLISRGIFLRKINVDFYVIYNKVLNCNEVGIEIDSCLPSILSVVGNNMIVGGTSSNFKNDRLLSIKNTGSFPEFNRSTNGVLSIANNSVLINNSNALAASVSLVNSNQMALYNNIFANYGTGYAVFYSTNYTDRVRFVAFKSNLIYAKSGMLANWKNVLCTSLAQMENIDTLMPFKLSTSPSLYGSFNPNFYSSNDLHLNNDSLNNNGFVLSYLNEDIDGQTRSITSPDIGCDEFSYAQDIAVKSFLNPLENQVLLGRDIPVQVSFTNYGAPIQQAKITYLFDGIKMDSFSYTFSPSLKKNETIIHTFTKKINTRTPGVHFIKVFFNSNPLDLNKINDTAAIEISTIDTADMYVSKFLSPLNNSLITTPTNVVVRVNNNGTMNIGDYNIVLKRDEEILETMKVVPIVNAKFYKDVQLSYIIQPNTNNTYTYCAYTVLLDDFNKSNDSNCIVVNTTKVGVDNSYSNNRLNVYPNSTTSKVYIDGLSNNIPILLKVYSIQGEVLLTKNIISGEFVDISDFANGIYLFKIGEFTFRVVKI